MHFDAATTITCLLILAMICQWLAWKFHLPALVLLSATGIFIGPVMGWISPVESIGSLLPQLVSLAVAIILFDGGLTLKWADLKKSGVAVNRMVILGAPLGWALIAYALHYIGGYSTATSAVFGGILVVTGPTVIMPMLRQAKLNANTSHILKWEGIVNDPIGAIFAVIAFEFILLSEKLTNFLSHEGIMFGGKILAICLGSYATGKGVALLYKRGIVPEYLKIPVLLTVVLTLYMLSNAIQHEGGLFAVTVLGVALANANLPSIAEIRRFKEIISLIFVSLLFIALTATLTPAHIAMINMADIMFVVALIFILRPLLVFIVLSFTKVTLPEKIFLSWTAPRGVVCVAISGLFGPLLVEAGYADADKMVPLSFLIVFSTVLLSGFLMRPMGRALGLVAENQNGVLLVGVNTISLPLARQLVKYDIPVRMVDSNWARIREARIEGIPTHYGEALSESLEHSLEMNSFSKVLALTSSYSYNSLACSHFKHEFGRDNVYQLAADREEIHDPKSISPTLKGRILCSAETTYPDLLKKFKKDWAYASSRLSDKFTYEDMLTEHGEESLPILRISESGTVTFAHTEHTFAPQAGDVVILLAPPRVEVVS